MNNRKLRIVTVQFEGSFVDKKFKDSWTNYNFKSGPRKGEYCGKRITDELKTLKFQELAATESLATLLNSVKLLNPEVGFRAYDPNHALLYFPSQEVNKFEFAITFEEFEAQSPTTPVTSIESVALEGFYLVQIEGRGTEQEVREYVFKNLTFLPPLRDLQYDEDADIYLLVFGVSEAKIDDFLGQ